MSKGQKQRTLRIAVHIANEGYGESKWGFTIEEPMPIDKDIIKHVSARLSEELRRHVGQVPQDLQLVAGSDDGEGYVVV